MSDSEYTDSRSGIISPAKHDRLYSNDRRLTHKSRNKTIVCFLLNTRRKAFGTPPRRIRLRVRCLMPAHLAIVHGHKRKRLKGSL